mgnify:CR=1 FL=1
MVMHPIKPELIREDLSENKKAKRKKGEIPIDLVDGDQLINRIKDLSIIF